MMESLLLTSDFEEKENDGFFSLDKAWNIIDMNMVAGGLFRLSPDKLIGKKIWRACPLLLGTEIEVAMRRTMETRIVHSLRVTGEMTDTWYNFLICPTHDGITVCCQDLSRMLMVQNLYDQCNHKLSFHSHLVENVHDAICAVAVDVDADMNDESEGCKCSGARIIYWNRYSEELLGWTASEVMGNHPQLVLRNRVVESYGEAARKKLRATGFHHGEIVLEHKEGHEVIVVVRSKAIMDEQGRICEVIHCFHDVTQQRYVENRLKESELAYRTLFNSIDEGFCILELIFDENKKAVDYVILEGNPAHDRIMGFGELKDRKASDILGAVDPMLLEKFHQMTLTGCSERFEYSSAITGRSYDVYASCMGEPPAAQIALVLSDITNRKQDEKELLESKANALRLVDELHQVDRHKNSFIATLSHELRNPLASIMTGVSVLELSESQNERTTKSLNIIKRQGQQLKCLVDDLLDVTRITQNKIHLKPRQLDLNKLIACAVEDYVSFFDEKGVCLEMELTSETLAVDGDEVRMKQAIENLLSNAAKFAGRNGWARIATKRDMELGDAVITVSDNGVGIQHEFQETMFKPFAQADTSLAHSNGGLGLGLVIAKSIIELHGGTVDVTSEGVGKGSAFTIRLPLMDLCEKPTPALTFEKPEKRRVLLIDDNPDLLEIMGEMVAVLGYEPIMAADGICGIAKAREHMPDMILCDIGLPQMDGYEVAGIVSKDQTLGHIPIVAITGYAQPEDKLRAKEAGFCRHLSKPVDIGVLKSTLAELASMGDS